MKSNFFNQDHHLNEETIAWVAEVLGEGEVVKLPEEVQEHLEGCVKCKQDIFFAREVLKFQEEKTQVTGSRRSVGWYGIAAVIILAIALIPWLLYVVTSQKKNQDSPVVVVNTDSVTTGSSAYKDTTRIIVEKQVLAANFKPVPHLEMLIGEAQRSSDIKMISPESTIVYKNEINFKWEGKAERLRIINNKEEKIIEVPLEGNEFLFRKTLESGLYYWLIENEGEVIAVGKFQKK